MGHADDQGRPGARDHRRQPQRARRRARQRHRPRPPGPRAEHRRRRLGQLHRRRSPGHLGDRLAADHQRPRHARRRHHRRGPQRRRHRRRRAERADGLGQGRQRRRVHLPGVRRLRLHLGRAAPHGRDEQQLLRRPVHVLLRGPARPVRRQGGRPSRRRTGRPTGASCTPRPPATRRPTCPTRRPTTTSPDDSTADHPHDQQRLRGHPDRAGRRGHRVVDAAFPAGRWRAGCRSFSNRGLGKIDVAAPGSRSCRRSSRTRHRRRNGYGTQERYVDGVAARRRRARADEVGAPVVDARADGREAARRRPTTSACGADHDRPGARGLRRAGRRTTATSARASWTLSTRSADPHQHQRGGRVTLGWRGLPASSGRRAGAVGSARMRHPGYP